MESLKIRLEGVAPLLVNSNCTVDPLNEYTQKIAEITGKGTKKMTLDDHAEVYRLKWHASLYYDEAIGPYIPSDNIIRCIRDGAAAVRKGKDVYRAVTVLQDKNPIKYKGPRDKDELYKNRDFVFIKQAKLNGKSTIMTCRPIFNDWSIEFDVLFNQSIINKKELITAISTAGTIEGIGTWRPRFGRFTSTVIGE